MAGLRRWPPSPPPTISPSFSPVLHKQDDGGTTAVNGRSVWRWLCYFKPVVDGCVSLGQVLEGSLGSTYSLLGLDSVCLSLGVRRPIHPYV